MPARKPPAGRRQRAAVGSRERRLPQRPFHATRHGLRLAGISHILSQEAQNDFIENFWILHV